MSRSVDPSLAIYKRATFPRGFWSHRGRFSLTSRMTARCSIGKPLRNTVSVSESPLQPYTNNGFHGSPVTSHRPCVPPSCLSSNSTWHLTRFVLKNKPCTPTRHSGNLRPGFQITQRSMITWNAELHQNQVWDEGIVLLRLYAGYRDSGATENELYVTGIRLLLCVNEELKQSWKTYKS